MSETPEAEAPVIPEPSPLETVARLAAEAASRARPDYGPRLEQAEAALQEILAALAAAAGPNGNAARLAERLDRVEETVGHLAARPIPANPEQQQLIDDLRLKVAHLERKPS